MKIVGITIGPISDTLVLAKRPATLWYASAAFSNLAFILCKNIRAKIKDSKLLVPYISDEDLEKSFSPDGVGKYHDRIIFEAENIDILDDIISESKESIVQIITNDLNNSENAAKDKQFLLDYIQTNYCILEKDAIGDNNIILEMFEPLDALEQMRTFNPDNTYNPFVRLFDKNKISNSDIGKCIMLRNVKDSQLKNKDGSFRSIDAIASKKDDSEVKKVSENSDDKTKHEQSELYYAIIQADGDRVGDYLKTIGNDEIESFSKDCISYSQAVSKTIASYGGMTIYSGGDDLLAIAPIIGTNGKNIFDLCIDVCKTFNDIVKKDKYFPTVSIGVAVRHHKFPLYEALNSASDALFFHAKNGKKNNTCVDFQKRNGQSIKISIPCDEMNFIADIMTKKTNLNAEITTVNSIIYILDQFRTLINAGSTSNTTIRNIFNNIYDNVSQKSYKPYVEKLTKYFEFIADSNIRVYDCENDDAVKTFEGLLKIKKFFSQEVKLDD